MGVRAVNAPKLVAISSKVVVNLLNNAARDTEPGGRISVEASVDVVDAILWVADTGIGILPELLSRVFELFTQGERVLARSQGGLGIGLSMVQTLVELHGGHVEVHSDGARPWLGFHRPPSRDAGIRTHDRPGARRNGRRTVPVESL